MWKCINNPDTCCLSYIDHLGALLRLLPSVMAFVLSQWILTKSKSVFAFFCLLFSHWLMFFCVQWSAESFLRVLGQVEHCGRSQIYSFFFYCIINKHHHGFTLQCNKLPIIPLWEKLCEFVCLGLCARAEFNVPVITDGLMVQVTMETMAELRRSLRDMKDFTVTCGKLHPAERQEYVHIQWQDEEPRFNKGFVLMPLI